MRVLDSVMDPERTETVGYIFLCPGCKMGHVLYIKKPHRRSQRVDHNRQVWSFNHNMVHPTFHPRVLVEWEKFDAAAENYVPQKCHFSVRNGELHFEPECTHHLAGQVVRMIVRDD